MRSLLIFLVVCLAPLTYAKTFSCNKFLNSISEGDTAAITESLISYLSVLLDKRVWDYQELKAFTKALEEKNILSHPFGQTSIDTRLERKIHYENLQNYLDHSSSINKSEVLKWAKSIVEKTEEVKVRREQSEEQAKDVYIKMRMLPVDFTKLNQPPNVSLSHSIEMTQTLVTQDMWMKEMGKNPSYFKRGGDYPVENMSLWSAMMFANKLSVRDGLKPFYDLDHIKWSGRAEDGTLAFEGQEEIDKIIEAVNKKNINEESGYRIPTLNEVLVVYHHIYTTTNTPFEEDVWHQNNAFGQTHEVDMGPSGVRNLLHDFTDIMGHLYIWTNDLEKKPNFAGNGFVILSQTVGGSWNTPVTDFIGTSRAPDLIRHGSGGYPINGLRLVRTIVKLKGLQL